MLKTVATTVVLVAAGLPQAASIQAPAPIVLVGSVELRLNMRRDEVTALLAPRYTVSVDGIVMTKSGPPFDAVGSVAFSDSGLLTYVSRSWGPPNQQEGVATAESLYGALSQVTKPSTTRIRNTMVQTCACTVFVYTTYSSGGETKHIEIWDGGKTVSTVVVRGSSIPSGVAVSIAESIGLPR